MPLYEYTCGRCSEQFEELVTNEATTPACPQCEQSDRVERIAFAQVTLGKKRKVWPPPDLKAARRPRR